ncbi:class I SAM-dependent methyltransferase [Saccharopolyspora tripterygii]
MNRFRARAERRASGRVLDIGSRRLSDLPAYQHVSHLALVGSGPELREAELPLPAEKVYAEPEQLPFPDRAFDVVVCRFALGRAERTASEIARVLRRTGHLLFLEIAGDTKWDHRPLVLAHLHRSGLITHDVEWTWPGSHALTPLVQGVAAHPNPQYERETAWLSSTRREGR